jgi:hypothetical protein
LTNSGFIKVAERRTQQQIRRHGMNNRDMRIDLSLKERPNEPSDDWRNENPEEEKKVQTASRVHRGTSTGSYALKT